MGKNNKARRAAKARTRTKARVKSEVQAVAQELVVLYQKRLHAPGHAFPQDTPLKAR